MENEIKINAVLVLDIIGKPKEYLVESLERLVGNIGREKGVLIVSKEIKDPVQMKDQKEFYSTFAEIEIEVEEISTLFILMFRYMPAHIEILSPSMLGMTNNILNEALNDMIRRLHSYDELSRVMQVEKQILIKKIEELGGEVPKGIMPPMQLQEELWEEEKKED